jgi:hypothetical protein
VDVVDRHILREDRGRVGRARPVAADGDVRPLATQPTADIVKLRATIAVDRESLRVGVDMS